MLLTLTKNAYHHSIRQTILGTYTRTQDFFEGSSGLWTWLFCLSKLAELGDTIFIVLRKRPLIFLHWYSHLKVLLCVCAQWTNDSFIGSKEGPKLPLLRTGKFTPSNFLRSKAFGSRRVFEPLSGPSEIGVSPLNYNSASLSGFSHLDCKLLCSKGTITSLRSTTGSCPTSTKRRTTVGLSG